ncbi:VOC family protein [Natronorubrum halophilum]|uniref:VOC family protein n=1 Tax=Natronorubrum halophilum TaxID=1702106 RepID=UPI000EF64CEC|nr:VOC family protein [Natronorubrum halophilum]
MIGSADHYGVVVTDMDTSLAFYRDTLGMELLDRFEQESEAFGRAVGVADTKVELAFLDANGCVVELIDYCQPEGENANDGVDNNDVGAAHFCLAVDDADVTYERLRGDVPFQSSPQELENGVKLAFMEDPDGNVVELLEE